MNQKRLFLISFFSFTFLVTGLMAAALGASFGFQEFTETQQSLLMLILPCCSLPLIIIGSSTTILMSQAKAQNDPTFVRMNLLGLAATFLITFSLTMLLTTLFG
ncbi:MAG: hypothetical protein Fur0022_27180 [Anaerolineales bacterium]